MRSAAVLLAALLCACSPEPTWSSWAADPESTRYAPLGQIDARNFGSLRIAWVWDSPDVVWKQTLSQVQRERPRRFGFFFTPEVDIAEFQVTPIFVDGVLYGVTSANQVFALDAGTGEQLWVHDPHAYHSSKGYWDFVWPKHRGVTYFEGRIYLPTSDAWLIALDAVTGKPVESFGEGGRVDLMEGLRGAPIRRLGEYFQTSPAVVAGDTIVVGSSMQDNPQKQRATPGDIRGYDARTGHMKWSFHVVPAEGEFGTETWEGESWRYSGAGNVWGPMSVDSERGFVYAVTTSVTNDHYGGHRLGDNLFSETLLCLDGDTGERIWHYQLIRHGLWDYDPSSSPILVDVTVDGRRVEAVAQVTKHGFVFVFDRVTGEPVWPIEDRPVPPSDIPGERAAATQPFPTKPPPFELQGTFEKDLVDFTPELHAKALALFRKFRTGPLFLPPSFEGSLILPGSSGGTAWRGAAVDVETGILYVPSIQLASALTIVPGKGGEGDARYVATNSTQQLNDVGEPHPIGLPIFKPPYSRITAIDLNRGDIVWQVANGEGPKDHPLLAGLDLPRLGSGVPTGILVTQTLVVTTDGAEFWFRDLGEPIVRAYDKANGDLVGEVRVPDKVRGVPMTYSYNGVQYVAMAIASKEAQNPRIVALALP